jgi:hypothetical protein
MRQDFTKIGRSDEFKIEPLLSEKSCGSFRCKIAEYNDYLVKDALRSMSDHIALTWKTARQSVCGKIFGTDTDSITSVCPAEPLNEAEGVSYCRGIVPAPQF